MVTRIKEWMIKRAINSFKSNTLRLAKKLDPNADFPRAIRKLLRDSNNDKVKQEILHSTMLLFLRYVVRLQNALENAEPSSELADIKQKLGKVHGLISQFIGDINENKQEHARFVINGIEGLFASFNTTTQTTNHSTYRSRFARSLVCFSVAATLAACSPAPRPYLQKTTDIHSMNENITSLEEAYKQEGKLSDDEYLVQRKLAFNEVQKAMSLFEKVALLTLKHGTKEGKSKYTLKDKQIIFVDYDNNQEVSQGDELILSIDYGKETIRGKIIFGSLGLFENENNAYINIYSPIFYSGKYPLLQQWVHKRNERFFVWSDVNYYPNLLFVKFGKALQFLAMKIIEDINK